MDDRTKGMKGDERTRGRGDEYLTGRADELPSTRAQEAGLPRYDERGSAVAEPPTTSMTGNAPTGAASGGTTAGAGRTSTPSRLDTASSDVRTTQIRAEIEQTREDMSETIEAIQDRLRPSNIASNAVSNVREAASERLQDVAESEMVQDLRANPIPTAMVGIGILGLAWLAFGGRDRHDYRTTGRRRLRGGRGYRAYDSDDQYYRGTQWRGASGYAGATTDAGLGANESGQGYGTRTGGWAEGEGQNLTARAGEYASRAGDYANEAGRTARQTARRAQNGLQRLMQENPLLVGAAAVAVGAVVGMALPETERENELMGDTRDQMIENVQSMARGAAERVQNAATEAAQRVQNVASEAAGLVGGSGESQEQNDRR